MKKFSQLSKGKTLDVQDNCINQIGAEDLKKYVEMNKSFLSSDTQKIIRYMISHNTDYVKILGGENSTNCIKDFYSRPRPKEAELAEIYDAIKKVNDSHRLLEIPTLQTAEQFNDIINGKISPDMIILDLKTEAGRNAAVKQYEKLIEKIVHQWIGKVNMDEKEIRSAAYEGFTFAMNEYGKKRKDKMTEDELEAVRSYTFGQFAAYMMRFAITGDANNTSRLVRIPISAISKERKEKGAIAKKNTISGDKKNGDDENSKSLFDYIGDNDADAGDRSLDQQDLDKLWAEVYAILEKEFDKKVIESWYSFLGLNGREKLKNKEIAERIGCQPSNVTYYINTVNNFIKNNPRVMKKFAEIYELMKECLHEREHDDDLIEEGFNLKDAYDKNNDDE